jgi:hypothetical protein
VAWIGVRPAVARRAFSPGHSPSARLASDQFQVDSDDYCICFVPLSSLYMSSTFGVAKF